MGLPHHGLASEMTKGAHIYAIIKKLFTLNIIEVDRDVKLECVNNWP